MTEKLRAALHETAEHAQPATVPPTLWEDAQRARSRNGAVLAALAVAIVCVLGSGLAVLTQPKAELSPAAGDDAGVPAYLFAISPDDTDEFDYQGEPPAAQDFAVGRTAAILPTSEGAWVAVSADDGSYRRLPDIAEGTKPTLSPDGRLLAWGMRGMDAVGVTVTDLETGEATPHALPGSAAGDVVSVAWSPNSRFVSVLSDEGGAGHMRVLDVATGVAKTFDGWSDDIVAAGMTLTGDLAVISGGRLEVRAPGQAPVDVQASDGLDGLWVSPDGTLAGGVRMPPGGPTAQPEASPDLVFLPLSDEAKGFGSVLMGSYDDVRVLGWTRDGHAVALGDVDPVEIEGETPRVHGALLIVKVGEDGHEVHRVGTVDATDLGGVQIAPDLMSLDRPTVGHGDPEWLDRDFPRARAMFFAIVLALIVWFVRRWRRGGFKGTPGGGGRAEVSWGQLEAEGRMMGRELGGSGGGN